jgi:hypothetical protein
VFIYFSSQQDDEEEKKKRKRKIDQDKVSVLKNIRVYKKKKRYRTANKQSNTECVYEKKN